MECLAIDLLVVIGDACFLGWLDVMRLNHLLRHHDAFVVLGMVVSILFGQQKLHHLLVHK